MEKNNELILDRSAVYIKEPPFPRNIMLEITSYCNHNCIFCGYGGGARKKRHADKNFSMDIIKQAYENGAREIGFYMVGEPFLNDDLSEYISYSRIIGYEYIYITTNGVYATPEKLKKVIDAGMNSIKFSINGATEESYKKIHGHNDFNTVVENLTWLRAYIDNNDLNVKTFISFVLCNYNKSEIEIFHSKFDGLVDKTYVIKCGSQAGFNKELITSGVVDDLVSATAPCFMVFNRVHITADGYLDACCADTNGSLIVADLHKMSLLDAWNCDKMVNLRYQHLNGFTENNCCKICTQKLDVEVVPINPDLFYNY